MMKSLFIIKEKHEKHEKQYLILFKNKFICSDEEIPKELCLLNEDDLEKKVLELIKGDKENRLILGLKKSLFFVDLNNPNNKLKNLPLGKIIKCNILSVDPKYFVDKSWYITLTLIAIIILFGIIFINIDTKYILMFGLILFLIDFYKVKILEKIYYKKVLRKLNKKQY